jgi:thiamine-monophosphate kinase
MEAGMGQGPRTVREAGEFGLIAELAVALPEAARAGPELGIGIGDDAAVWTPSPGEAVVVTTDSLVEGIHFRLDWTDWFSLGHKALAVNLSDLAAMGAVPRIATVSLGLRGDEPVEDLRNLYRGLGALAARTGTRIAGGDIVRSPHRRALHVTALGEARGGRVLRRDGARSGDVVAVSGTLGASAAGMALLAGEGDRRAATADVLVAAHLRPEPRLAVGRSLVEVGASAAMDLSDGLYGDLPKILAASRVSARIDLGRLPVAAAVRALFPERWLDLATRGGEDYELLFTVPSTRWDEVDKATRDVGSTVTAIGEVVPATATGPRMVVFGLGGGEREIAPGAFDHFEGDG